MSTLFDTHKKFTAQMLCIGSRLSALLAVYIRRGRELYQNHSQTGFNVAENAQPEQS